MPLCRSNRAKELWQMIPPMRSKRRWNRVYRVDFYPFSANIQPTRKEWEYMQVWCAPIYFRWREQKVPQRVFFPERWRQSVKCFHQGKVTVFPIKSTFQRFLLRFCSKYYHSPVLSIYRGGYILYLMWNTYFLKNKRAFSAPLKTQKKLLKQTVIYPLRHFKHSINIIAICWKSRM